MIKSHAITFGRLYTWTLTFYYDKVQDVLSIRAPWRDQGKPVELPDGVQVMVDPATGEAVAFRITAFRQFLAKHIELQVPWEQVRPSPIALRRMENTPFIGAFLEVMERLAYDGGAQVDPRAL